MNIYLNHIEVITRILENPIYKDHFSIYDLSDKSDLFNRLTKMSEDQYSYFKILLNKKKWFDLKNFLDRFLKHKIIN